MKHDVVVLPFRKTGSKSIASAACEHACALDVAPYSSATADPVCLSAAHTDLDAMSVAIALRYLSGRLRVSVRTKR